MSPLLISLFVFIFLEGYGIHSDLHFCIGGGSQMCIRDGSGISMWSRTKDWGAGHGCGGQKLWQCLWWKVCVLDLALLCQPLSISNMLRNIT